MLSLSLSLSLSGKMLLMLLGERPQKAAVGSPSEMVVTLQDSPGFATEKTISSRGGDNAAPTTSCLVS